MLKCAHMLINSNFKYYSSKLLEHVHAHNSSCVELPLSSHLNRYRFIWHAGPCVEKTFNVKRWQFTDNWWNSPFPYFLQTCVSTIWGHNFVQFLSPWGIRPDGEYRTHCRYNDSHFVAQIHKLSVRIPFMFQCSFECIWWFYQKEAFCWPLISCNM